MRDGTRFEFVHLGDHAAAIHGLLLHRAGNSGAVGDAFVDPFDIVRLGHRIACNDATDESQGRYCVFHDKPPVAQVRMNRDRRNRLADVIHYRHRYNYVSQWTRNHGAATAVALRWCNLALWWGQP